MTDALEPGVRRAEPADLGHVVALTREAYASYLPLLKGPPAPMTEDYAPRIERGEVWIATCDEQPVGLLVLEIEPGESALIYSVAVAPSWQGRGVGGALLRFAERFAREAGCDALTLYTNAKMEQNITIYAACGFRETARRPNPYRPGWELVDMAKTLGE